MKHINEMTRKEFESLPDRESWKKPVFFDSLVIIPGRARDLHESGFRLMDYIAIKDSKPLCKLSGCSDVLHLDGIGGFGNNWVEKYKGCPTMVPPKAWSIDCLKKSGLLRLWVNGHQLEAGNSLSSFEIYANKIA